MKTLSKNPCKEMRIAVIDFAASIGGATSILKSFYEYLVESKDNNEWFFLLSDDYISETENIKVIKLEKEKKSRFRRLLFDYFYGRSVIRKINPDALFYLQNTLIHGVACKQIAYMDQSIPFQKVIRFRFFDPMQRSLAVYQFIIGRLIKQACKRADCIIVQTEWMRRAISSQCRVDLEQIKRIPPDIILPKLDSEKKMFYKDRFFYPANYAYYKNHRCIIKAVELLNQLGITDFSVQFTITEKDINTPLPKQIACSGNIPHEEVMRLLDCETLLFPSYIETYGLPIAEAKNLKTVILAADTDFAREILDGYENAYFFNPFKPEQLADLMKEVIEGRIICKPVKSENKTKRSSSWKDVVKTITKTVNNETI